MSASDVIGIERLEALLRGDAPRTDAETARAMLFAELRGATLRAPDALRARVAAAVPTPRRRELRLPSRRLVFVAVPAALAVAVGAAVVHGLAGSGTKTAQPLPARIALPATKLLAPAGAVSSGGAASALQPAPTVGSGTRLQHTDASLQVRVPDVTHLSAATTAATRIATSLGGYAQSVVYRTPQSGGGTATLILRVPAQNVRTAIAKLAALGTLESQQVSVKDLQHDFAVETAQIAELRTTVAALTKALRSRSLPQAQRILLGIRLAAEKRELAQRLHARTGTVTSGTTASISLVLSTQRAAVAVPHHRGRLGRMLHSAVGFLGLEGTIVLYALIVVAPFVLIAAVGWGLVRVRRRRDENRLLTT
jgi:hypothetical protein